MGVSNRGEYDGSAVDAKADMGNMWHSMADLAPSNARPFQTCTPSHQIHTRSLSSSFRI